VAALVEVNGQRAVVLAYVEDYGEQNNQVVYEVEQVGSTHRFKLTAANLVHFSIPPLAACFS
jgi:arginyl-tRNA synthetase